MDCVGDDIEVDRECCFGEVGCGRWDVQVRQVEDPIGVVKHVVSCGTEVYKASFVVVGL